MAKRIETTQRGGRGDVALWEALRFLYCDRRVVTGAGDAARLADEHRTLDAAGLPAGERVERLCQFAVDVLGASSAAVQAHLARARDQAAGGESGAGRRAARRRRLTTEPPRRENR